MPNGTLNMFDLKTSKILDEDTAAVMEANIETKFGSSIEESCQLCGLRAVTDSKFVRAIADSSIAPRMAPKWRDLERAQIEFYRACAATDTPELLDEEDVAQIARAASGPPSRVQRFAAHLQRSDLLSGMPGACRSNCPELVDQMVDLAKGDPGLSCDDGSARDDALELLGCWFDRAAPSGRGRAKLQGVCTQSKLGSIILAYVNCTTQPDLGDVRRLLQAGLGGSVSNDAIRATSPSTISLSQRHELVDVNLNGGDDDDGEDVTISSGSIRRLAPKNPFKCSMVINPPPLPGPARPNGGLEKYGQCWYLSKRGTNCRETCLLEQLVFHWFVVNSSRCQEPIIPQLKPVGDDVDKRGPWAPLEALRSVGDEHLFPRR
ncbi:unnamed protein product [Prorocentrum cordatum]|uniref:Uncharacterized protein n=1 Tax=Prorocentrum cordatum TaxID=2364126 RepID=A0ABN9WNW5_9DINO|nr:unnamed protein product [Polarella glacialis]